MFICKKWLKKYQIKQIRVIDELIYKTYFISLHTFFPCLCPFLSVFCAVFSILSFHGHQRQSSKKKRARHNWRGLGPKFYYSSFWLAQSIGFQDVNKKDGTKAARKDNETKPRQNAPKCKETKTERDRDFYLGQH